MKYLLVHADDLGLTSGVCAGIAQSIEQGIVTGTSAMVCAHQARELILEWEPKIKAPIGLHLQVTDGTPCLPPEKIPSLVTEQGEFPRSSGEIESVNTQELKQEWRAQARRCAQLGVQPAFVDTHHHAHQFPHIFAVYRELAYELGLPARTLTEEATAWLCWQGVVCADYCQLSLASGQITAQGLLAELEASFARYTTVELVCHPGFWDQELEAVSGYTRCREQELELLTSAVLAREIANLGITRGDVSILNR